MSDTNEAIEHEQSTSPTLNNNIIDDDDDDDSGEDAPLQFGEPLHQTFKPKQVGHADEVMSSPPSAIPSVHRQLDLDDFANSPAADADDRGSSEEEGEDGHDVEMRVAMG